ncbi:MAG: hypothetical protein IJW15_06090 [Clostridia bacterium]|nr:hypothetical protein [Clostridia bacterium]
MNKQIKNITATIVFALVLAALSLACFLKPETAFSASERRPLAEKPPLSSESVFSGEYMTEFEEYTVDQFPFRETLRSIKALFSTKVFGKADNNGIFTADGHISKIEYPQNDEMLKLAADRFKFLYDTYMKDKDMNVYLSIVPDKNYFLAEKNGYLSLDYKKFIEDFKESVPYMQYIDIIPLLSLDDYYFTDSHWRQENITDIAQHLAKEMGIELPSEYTVNTLENPFHGVYLGQSALPKKPDTIKYLTSETLDDYTVTYYDNGLPEIRDMYDMEKAAGKDPYEMFLSGTSPLITIENPNAANDKDLILFRDSFGSSIAPLLASGYKKITVVDIRYMQSAFLGNFIEFDNQDVLFLYSTTLLNNSTALR